MDLSFKKTFDFVPGEDRSYNSANEFSLCEKLGVTIFVNCGSQHLVVWLKFSVR